MTSRMNWDRARDRDRSQQIFDRPLRSGRAGDLPATPKQLALLRTLGVQHGGGLTRLVAGRLIETYKRKSA